jgi:hypothetical protein
VASDIDWSVASADASASTLAEAASPADATAASAEESLVEDAWLREEELEADPAAEGAATAGAEASTVAGRGVGGGGAVTTVGGGTNTRFGVLDGLVVCGPSSSAWGWSSSSGWRVPAVPLPLGRDGLLAAVGFELDDGLGLGAGVVERAAGLSALLFLSSFFLLSSFFPSSCLPSDG